MSARSDGNEWQRAGSQLRGKARDESVIFIHQGGPPGDQAAAIAEPFVEDALAGGVQRVIKEPFHINAETRKTEHDRHDPADKIRIRPEQRISVPIGPAAHLLRDGRRIRPAAYRRKPCRVLQATGQGDIRQPFGATRAISGLALPWKHPIRTMRNIQDYFLKSLHIG